MNWKKKLVLALGAHLEWRHYESGRLAVYVKVFSLS